jgi:predicted component of type VI protein secretion system
LILDVRTELHELRAELSSLQELEQHVSRLLNSNP